MATAIVVGVSTGALKPVLEKLATLLGDEFSKVKNVRKDVKFLSDELTSMNVFLESLEAVDELDAQTKHWRNKVRNMSYDIENIMDDFRRKIVEKNAKGGLAKKTIRFLKSLRARYQIAGQIEGIKKLVRETSERHERYKFNTPPSSDVLIDPRVAILQQGAASLVGVKVQTEKLIDWLNDKEKQLKVVSIVGFGGLGKTTLANEIYRQPEGGFECRAFVSVTLKHNIPELIRSLLSELGSEECYHDCKENVLVNKLKKYLQNKRYLIVIDDLWEELPWDIIKGAFPDNGLRSRVITTTRIHDVAKACCSNPRDYILKMKPLSDEDSRSLFFGRIFNSEEACPHQLRDVSIEILRKCGGMPLAIITISGMLARSERFNQAEWERIRDSLGSGTNFTSSKKGTNFTLKGMRKILDLSYRDLPPHLKTCLLYIGMYPEDYKIPRHQLELQWIGEGFISTENGQDVKKVARSYFNELVNRSLIQFIEYDTHSLVTECKVHDIMRDLILCKCTEENFLTIVNDPQAITKLDNTVHRLSLQFYGPINATMLPGNNSLSQVRTYMIFGWFAHVLPLSLFKFLRVLHIEQSKLNGLDLAALAKMYQLRYLASGRTGMDLPTQIRGLRHLETLDVHNYNLPSDIVHLQCLMFLNINWRSTPLPDGIGNMKSLRNVEEFELMSNSVDNIEGLGELTSLRILEVYSWADNAASMKRRMDALCSSLGKICSSLERLGLHIKGCMDILMNLSPPPRRLERLSMFDRYHSCQPSGKIGRYVGPIWRVVPKTFFSRVPNWMSELINLKKLEIHVLKADVSILAELPALMFLRLYIMEFVRERIIICAKAFPVLKCFELRLSSASYLAFQAGAMPKLQWLGLQFCGVGWHQDVPAPAGIHHLSTLEDFVAIIETDCLWETSAESALKSAIDMHRTHPRVHIELLYSSAGEMSFSPTDDYESLRATHLTMGNQGADVI